MEKIDSEKDISDKQKEDKEKLDKQLRKEKAKEKHKVALPKLKILYLHGFLQSSKIFKERMEEINKALSKVFLLTSLFPQGDYIIEKDEITNEEKRGWMKLENIDYSNLDFKEVKDVLSQESVKYLGLEQTLAIIKQIALENPDIDCIFGFSQGSLIALIVAILYSSYSDFKEWFPNLKSLVLVSGFVKPYPENKEFKINELVKNYIQGKCKISIPTFNVYGENDDHIIPEKSEEIIKFFETYKIYKHPGKHFVPSKGGDKQAFVEFFKVILDKDISVKEKYFLNK